LLSVDEAKSLVERCSVMSTLLSTCSHAASANARSATGGRCTPVAHIAGYLAGDSTDFGVSGRALCAVSIRPLGTVELGPSRVPCMAAVRSLGGNFSRLWAAAAISNFGDGLRLAAFPLLAATITRDPGLVAGLTVALRLPWLIFAVPAGGFADRFDRRRLMAFVSAAQGLVMAVFGLVVVVGGGQLVVLYVAAFLLGLGEVTFDTTSQTLVPAIVERDDLESANSRLIATERVVNELAGPPVGSFLFAVAIAAPFVVDAVTFAVGSAVILGISGRFHPKNTGKGSVLGSHILEGFRWLWTDRLFAYMIGLGVAVNLAAGAVTSILVLFALETLGISEVGYGLFLSALAAGGIGGAVLAPKLRRSLGPGTLMLSGVMIQGVGYGIAALLSNPLAAASALAVVQAGFFSVLVVFFSLRQAIVPDHLLGRVTGAMRLIGAGALPVGAALGGTIAEVYGLRAPFVMGGVLLVLAAVSSSRIVNNTNIDRALSNLDAVEE